MMQYWHTGIREDLLLLLDRTKAGSRGLLYSVAIDSSVQPFESLSADGHHGGAESEKRDAPRC